MLDRTTRQLDHVLSGAGASTITPRAPACAPGFPLVPIPYAIVSRYPSSEIEYLVPRGRDILVEGEI